jgi:hypothetical protein
MERPLSSSFSVALAYNNFGNRVKKVQQKLQEKLPELAQKVAKQVSSPAGH